MVAVVEPQASHRPTCIVDSGGLFHECEAERMADWCVQAAVAPRAGGAPLPVSAVLVAISPRSDEAEQRSRCDAARRYLLSQPNAAGGSVASPLLSRFPRLGKALGAARVGCGGARVVAVTRGEPCDELLATLRREAEEDGKLSE